MPAVAVVGAAVVGGIIASESQRKSANIAADAATRAQRSEDATTMAMYRRTQQLQKPWLDRGERAARQYSSIDTGEGLDEWIKDIQGIDTYINEMKDMDFNFEFDENDEIYKWRQSENERRVNQFMASRGKYDSSAAGNMLLRSGMELQSQEVGRQYGMYKDRYMQKYNKLLDMANLRSSQATTGYNMQRQVNLDEADKLRDVMTVGANVLSQAGTNNARAANQMIQSSQVASQAQQNAALQRGAAQAQLGTTIAQAPANYMLAQYLTQ